MTANNSSFFDSKLSYLVPRDPSILCWEDRVKLDAPRTKNLIQLGLDDTDEMMDEGSNKLKVYLRLKPTFSSESPYSVLSSTTLETEAPKDSVSFKNATNGAGKLIHKFTFTHILDQETTQEHIFEKCVQRNLKKFLSGENYLLLAYGTTSAGKTHTMQGTIEKPGVIPRAMGCVFTSLKDNLAISCKYQLNRANEIFEMNEEQYRKELSYKNFILNLDLSKYQKHPETSYNFFKSEVTIQTSSSSGFSEIYENQTFREMQSNINDTTCFETSSDKHAVWISIVEVYNEQVYDLLEVPDEKGGRTKMCIGEDESGNVYIKNLRQINVSSGHEAFQVLQFGRANLHLAPTALNHKSSRSHCICTVTLARFMDFDNSPHAIISRFSFCDLAGMERAKKTLNFGERLVESKSINTSLLILVKCLTVIKENQTNKDKRIVPFRESKLTRLFRDAMVGRAKFSMIVNITTDPHLFDETLNVLKFSAIAQKIVPQNIFLKPKRIRPIVRSRFSNIVAKSQNSTKTLIDWEMSTIVEDQTGVDTTNNAYQSLLELIDKYKADVEYYKVRCSTIEQEIRDELTARFSEIIKKNDQVHLERLKRETTRLQGMFDRKENRLKQYYEKRAKKRKFEESERSEEKSEDVVVDVEIESRLQELEKENHYLKLENNSLREQMHNSAEERNRLQVQCSQTKFEMAEKEKELCVLKRLSRAAGEGDDSLIKELESAKQELEARNSELKSLLDEAVVEFKEVTNCNECLKEEAEKLEADLVKQHEIAAKLKSEVSESQILLTEKTEAFIDLEYAYEENKIALDIANNELQQLQLSYDEVKKKELDNLTECNELRSLIDKKSEELNELQVTCEAQRSEIELLQKENKSLILKNRDLENEKTELLQNCKESNSTEKLKEYEDIITALRSELKSRQLEHDVDKEKIAALESQCSEQNLEIQNLGKEVKKLIEQMPKEFERNSEEVKKTHELEARITSLDAELEISKKEATHVKAQLEKEIEDNRSSRQALELEVGCLQLKLEAAEYQSKVMKEMKDMAENEALLIPELQGRVELLQNELDNKEKELATFVENRQAVFNNYEKEISRLKEDNERLRKDVVFANELVVKNATPRKADKEKIDQLKRSVKKKNEEIYKIKVQNSRLDETQTKLNNTRATVHDVKRRPHLLEELDLFDSKENSPFVSVKKKGAKGDFSSDELTKRLEESKLNNTKATLDDQNIQNLFEDFEVLSCKDYAPLISVTKGEDTPEQIRRQIEELSLINSQKKMSTRKGVNNVDDSVHPCTLKKTKGRRGKKEDKDKDKDKDKEKEREKDLDKKKEDSKKKTGAKESKEDQNVAEETGTQDKKTKKFPRKLFVDNDFEKLGDLESSFVEPEIPRLRPRK